MLVVEMVSQYTNPYVIIGDGGYEVRVTSQYLVCAAVSVLQIGLQCEHHILAVHVHHVTQQLRLAANCNVPSHDCCAQIKFFTTVSNYGGGKPDWTTLPADLKSMIKVAKTSNRDLVCQAQRCQSFILFFQIFQIFQILL